MNRDPDSEQDIARYVEIETGDESVEHAERVKEEFVVGEKYEIWDVTTDKARWWVITNLTNLYSQEYFPSLDYTLSFHVGLMMRLRSRPSGADASDPTPFDEVFRRQEQAKTRFDSALEAEDFQSVGMHLRECLISLVGAVRRQLELPPELDQPQDSNFVAWADVLLNMLCSGSSNKALRHFLKGSGKDAWQLVNWLTHDRDANRISAFIAIQACDMLVGHLFQLLQQAKATPVSECPTCNSRNIRQHYDATIASDGDYYHTCGKCGWSTHPETNRTP